MIKNLFLASLNKTLNTYLNLDPESKPRLKKLAGKIFSIELLPMHFTFYCQFELDKIIFSSEHALPVTAKIIGTPLQMLSVMIDKKNRQRFFAEDMRIEGDAELAQQVIDLFDHLQIDWQEHFSHLLGDVPVFHANRMLHKLGNWLKQTDKSMSQNIDEYIHEEARWLPAREALQDFFSEIDLIRTDVDRLEMRLNALKRVRNSSESI